MEFACPHKDQSVCRARSNGLVRCILKGILVGADTLVWISLGLFVPAAMAGLALASLHWRGKFPPWPLTILHGLFVAGGIITLFIASGPFATLGILQGIIGVFLLAATGGVMVLSFHIRKRHPPKVLMIAHASGAITAFLLLLLYALRVIPH